MPNADPAEADVLILPVPHEKTVTYNQGTRNGPDAILAASDQLEFYEEDKNWAPTRFMKLAVLDPVETDDRQTPAGFHEQLHGRVKDLNNDALLIALGGEHSITPDMVFAHMPEGGTIVQIDAHADYRESYHGSIYNHACPMYRIRKQGYALIQIGIRSLNSNEAQALVEDDGITTYFDRQLQHPEQWHALLSQLNSLQGNVWLTIDMDGFDPAAIPGVGTPQPGGLSWHQGLDILETLTDNNAIRLRGVDIVELIPDPSSVSDMMAAKLVQKCISYWGKAQGFDQREAIGSQAGVEDE
ncbi:MAG: agmatinase [Candidatus Thiodiazotropha sp. (ex Myrtea sp. 'scaly one' KF741663)]|nr:agmatinase [Candidatus Thiodiazotropha sp. (ex Myrtea sp. 'scaly one' KF741663)]